MRFIFLCFIAILNGDVGYFQPPKGWHIVDPKQLSPHVRVMFMGKGEGNFSPTINLATEETEGSLKEYFKGVKEFHRSNPEETWRDLGKFSLNCGEGRLTEISSPSPAGEVRMLQAIFVKEKVAYVLTGAALKSEFMQHQSTLLESIRSLKIVPHLFDAITTSAEKSKIEGAFASLAERDGSEEIKWKEWQTLLGSPSSQLGEYWHFLALKEGWARIHNETSAGQESPLP